VVQCCTLSILQRAGRSDRSPRRALESLSHRLVAPRGGAGAAGPRVAPPAGPGGGAARPCHHFHTGPGTCRRTPVATGHSWPGPRPGAQVCHWDHGREMAITHVRPGTHIGHWGHVRARMICQSQDEISGSRDHVGHCGHVRVPTRCPSWMCDQCRGPGHQCQFLANAQALRGQMTAASFPLVLSSEMNHTSGPRAAQ
jgi:hypothetical protein